MIRWFALPTVLMVMLGSSTVGGATGIATKALALPATAYSPATISRAFVDPNSNERNSKYWPRSIHSLAYKRFGRVTGYFQQAELPEGSKKVHILYDASVFKRSKGATGAWHDASGNLLSYSDTELQPCAAGVPATTITGCTRVSALHGKYPGYYDEIVTGRCLIETEAYGLKGAFLPNQAASLAILDNVDTVAYTQDTPLCSVP